MFVTYAAMEDMPNVRLGDGRTVKAEGKGSVCLRIKDDKEAERVICLSSVLFVPDLSCNLFSVWDITDKGNRMMFDDITCRGDYKGRRCDCKWSQARELVCEKHGTHRPCWDFCGTCMICLVLGCLGADPA